MNIAQQSLPAMPVVITVVLSRNGMSPSMILRIERKAPENSHGTLPENLTTSLRVGETILPTLTVSTKLTKTAEARSSADVLLRGRRML